MARLLVIVGITTSDKTPALNAKKTKIENQATKVAKARIKNGQVTVTAVGKEGGLVYLWVIDTGKKETSACCPIDVKLAPTKLEA